MAAETVKTKQISKPTLDDTAILALHDAGKGVKAISKIAGLNHKTIARRLKSLTPRKTTEIYRELKTEILEEKCRKLLMQGEGLAPKEQRDLAVAYGVYADKIERAGGNREQAPMVIINKINISGQSGSVETRLETLPEGQLIDV
ncbi:MAG: hypothetical protein WC332_00970 [Clostridia bacterium]|jgi:hypothetical protein